MSKSKVDNPVTESSPPVRHLANLINSEGKIAATIEVNSTPTLLDYEGTVYSYTGTQDGIAYYKPYFLQQLPEGRKKLYKESE